MTPLLNRPLEKLRIRLHWTPYNLPLLVTAIVASTVCVVALVLVAAIGIRNCYATLFPSTIQVAKSDIAR